MDNSEQNKTEEPTQFKLKRAREKGQVAKGTDLGFLSVLIAFASFFLIFGRDYLATVSQAMRLALSAQVNSRSQPAEVLAILGDVAKSVFAPLLFLAGTLIIVVIFVELLQLRGIVFSAHPLKPDFKRLSPAKGFKRVFSLRTLKETLKNIIKLAAYSTVAYLFIRYSIDEFGIAMRDGRKLVGAMEVSALRLLFIFMALAFFFAIIDQIIVRKEFSKQMRMSRRELTRETKDREGDPRQKQNRKQLHQEFSKQNSGMGDVAGSDVVITNPQHYAAAMRYDPEIMEAPQITAKGRNQFAQAIKREAFLHSVTVIENPPLARALYRDCNVGNSVPDHLFHDVASIYLVLRRQKKHGDAADGDVNNDLDTGDRPFVGGDIKDAE